MIPVPGFWLISSTLDAWPSHRRRPPISPDAWSGAFLLVFPAAGSCPVAPCSPGVLRCVCSYRYACHHAPPRYLIYLPRHTAPTPGTSLASAQRYPTTVDNLTTWAKHPVLFMCHACHAPGSSKRESRIPPWSGSPLSCALPRLIGLEVGNRLNGGLNKRATLMSACRMPNIGPLPPSAHLLAPSGCGMLCSHLFRALACPAEPANPRKTGPNAPSGVSLVAKASQDSAGKMLWESRRWGELGGRCGDAKSWGKFGEIW